MLTWMTTAHHATPGHGQLCTAGVPAAPVPAASPCPSLTPAALTGVKRQEAGEARHLGRLAVAACRQGSRAEGGRQSHASLTTG